MTVKNQFIIMKNAFLHITNARIPGSIQPRLYKDNIFYPFL